MVEPRSIFARNEPTSFAATVQSTVVCLGAGDGSPDLHAQASSRRSVRRSIALAISRRVGAPLLGPILLILRASMPASAEALARLSQVASRRFRTYQSVLETDHGFFICALF